MKEETPPRMRTEMSSLDLLFLQNELKFLVGGKIEKIYQSAKSLRIEIFLSGKGTFELYFEPGKLFITEYKRKAPEQPPSFCMLLRKHLEGQNIIDIRQRGFERIIEIETEKNILILELFSKGNVILCDKAFNIIMPLEIQLWKDREVLPKKPYKYPPSAANPFALDLYNFKKILASSDKSTVAFLATNLSLSGVYAEEVCARAGVDKNKKCRDIGSEAQKIFDAVQSLLKEFKPQLILENEKPADFAPFDLKIYEGKQKKLSQTFTHVLDEYFTEREVEKTEAKAEKSKSEELQKFERIRNEQKEAVKRLKKRDEESRKKAEAIYNNFELIGNILSAIDKAKKSGISWEKIKQHIAEEDTPETQAIKEIREGDAVIVLRIGKTDIDIDFRKTPHENAEEYYEEAKRYKKKIEATQDALKKTDKEIRKIINIERPTAEKAVSTIQKRRRGKWFEKFRWFVTTDDFLVVGGRDATQNEIIFKKYLKPEDIVLHADVAGAPLTIIKSEGREITPLAIREAAEFAAAYSSAWKEKFAAIDVYWIRPEQVSKSPKAGEFLLKGSFIIRGEKNYLKKTELKISIGIKIVEEEGMIEARPICGNVQAASKHAKYFVTLFPGDVLQQELAKQIVHKILLKALPEDKPLIEKIPLEEIQKLIPSGGGTLVG